MLIRVKANGCRKRNSTCDFEACEIPHVIRMWNLTCEISHVSKSHVKFHTCESMWNFCKGIKKLRSRMQFKGDFLPFLKPQKGMNARVR